VNGPSKGRLRANGARIDVRVERAFGFGRRGQDVSSKGASALEEPKGASALEEPKGASALEGRGGEMITRRTNTTRGSASETAYGHAVGARL
jgi:hypothetical protein